MFHKEGYRIIMNTFVLVAAIAVLAEYKISIEWIKIVQITALILLILVLQFFRNPKRTTPKNEKHLISPVDGKVVIVQKFLKKNILKINDYRFPSLCLP